MGKGKHRALLIGAILAVLPFSAHAHPHASIEIKVELVFNENGSLSGLREKWLFDEGYTAFALEEVLKEGEKADHTKVDALFLRNIHNLVPYRYYTHVEIEGRSVDFGSVASVSTALFGRRVEMTFFIPFTEAQDVKNKALKYAVFDPSYYIEMVHAKNPDAIRFKNPPSACRSEIKQPQPDAALVARAFALDQSETGEDGLGRHFAEWVTVTCP